MNNPTFKFPYPVQIEVKPLGEPHTAQIRVGRIDPVPTPTVPAETVPAETVPAETVPAETVPAETVPAETVPAETVPAETVPAETVEESPIVGVFDFPYPVKIVVTQI